MVEICSCFPRSAHEQAGTLYRRRGTDYRIRVKGSLLFSDFVFHPQYPASSRGWVCFSATAREGMCLLRMTQSVYFFLLDISPCPHEWLLWLPDPLIGDS
ncbi:unnamed protein product [Discosporangium mesarthrocarpum]